MVQVDGVLPTPSISGRTDPVRIGTTPACQHKVGHGKQGVELGGVLGQTLIADLAMPKQVLDDVEEMLDLGADPGLDRFQLFQQPTLRGLRQRLALARAQCDVPLRADALGDVSIFHALVSDIPVDMPLSPVHQRMSLGDVMNVGGGADDGVHPPGGGIHADVAFMPICH